jgi:hypothetical protein
MKNIAAIQAMQIRTYLYLLKKTTASGRADKPWRIFAPRRGSSSRYARSAGLAYIGKQG